jgi:hypothetical protein
VILEAAVMCPPEFARKYIIDMSKRIIVIYMILPLTKGYV